MSPSRVFSADTLIDQPAGGSAGKQTVPVDVQLNVDEASIIIGATMIVDVVVTADAELSSVHVDLTATGDMEVLGSPTIDVGVLGRGESYQVQIPVSYSAVGRSDLRAHVAAQSSDGSILYERNRHLYAIVEASRSFAGTGGYQLLELRAIEEDQAAGLLSEKEAKVRARRMGNDAVQLDQTPRPSFPMSLQEQQMSETLLAPPSLERPLQSRAISPSGTVTVEGTISWADENGAIHPAFGMLVQVRDDELIGSSLVAEDLTGVDGHYFFVVNNDDPGGRDIFVRIRTINGAASVESSGIFGGPYEAESSVHDDVADGATITWNFTCSNTGTGPACGILTGLSYVAVYTSDLNGGTFLPGLKVEWPGGDTSTSFYTGSKINLLELDRFDWDVFDHEWGHYVMDSFNIERNPGDDHSSNCLSDYRGSKDVGIRLAWGEGWPTFFGTSGQQIQGLSSLNVPRVGDVSYQDTEDITVNYSLETQSNVGEDDERAVQRMLWDLYDTPADSRDTVDLSDHAIFDPLNAADPENLSQAWAALRSGLSNSDDLAYGGIATDHGVGPALVSPGPGTVVGTSNATFSWNRGVGCSTTYDGNSFALVFYNAATLAKITTIGGLTSTSRALSAGELQTLIGASHDVLWAVEASNTDSPATGPYLGENFAIVVNRPPVADAGPDIVAECESPTTTSVQLDGTASSDPDGDTLAFSWEPAALFANPNSATPTGSFTMGSTVVTLTVSDGIEEDSDTVVVTVEDTTPPDIFCPADITVECTQYGGTPMSDPEIQAFLNGATATDICDTSPSIEHDVAPGFLFPVRQTTVVTFTATDDSGNASMCTASVTVEDTTPPTFAISVDPSELWPPNHKMVDIVVSVDELSDICDPSPTFVLVSITSNEPADDGGDGNTEPDIDGHVPGTDDTRFRLRAERSGIMSGRKYTIDYLASDGCGNTTPATVCVTVAHDQAGMSVAAEGFGPDGRSFTEQAEAFSVVIPTVARSEEPLGIGNRDDTVEALEASIRGEAVGFNAALVDVRHAYVGNTAGVAVPLHSVLADTNGDGLVDLVLYYAVAAVKDIGDGSDDLDGPVALHYRTPTGNYLVPDIFALGNPVVLALGGDEGLGRDASDSSSEMKAEAESAPPAEERSQLDVPVGDAADQWSGGGTPARTRVLGIRPNPFNPSATIVFELAGQRSVQIEVYDLQGKRVRSLMHRSLPAGRHEMAWDGKDGLGKSVASGVYVIMVDWEDGRAAMKAVLTK